MVEYNSRAYIPYSNTTDIYNISFTYRHREEIFINIKDSDGITTEYLVGMDWKFLNDSQVKLISKPSVGAIIEIYRQTNNTNREAKFAASDVSIGELDDSADQTFKIVQEAVDIANLSREESITTAIAAEQALINSEQALENSEEAVDAAGSAAESASTARNAAINAAENAAQAVSDMAAAQAEIDTAVATVNGKANVDGSNINWPEFLSAGGFKDEDLNLDLSDIVEQMDDLSATVGSAVTEMHATIDAALAGINTAKTLSMVDEVEIDLAEANIFRLELTGVCKFANPTNPKPGSFTIFLTQDSTGEHTVEWDGRYTWPNGVAPTLSTDPYKTDVIRFESADGLSFRGIASTGYDLPAVPRLSLSNSSLAASAVVGNSPADHSFDVVNSGELTLNWELSEDSDWVALSQTSGSTTGSTTIGVVYSTTELGLGEYAATVTATSDNGDNSPQTLDISLHITEVPDATINTSISSFNHTVFEGNDAATRTFELTNTGGEGSSLAYSITTDQSWMSAVTASGSLSSGESDTVEISFDTDALSEGIYTGNISIAAEHCTSSPVVIPVTLEVSAGYSTITVGTDCIIDTHNIGYTSITKLNDTQAIACYADTTLGTSKAVLLELSGATVSVLSSVVYNSAVSYYPSVVRISDTMAIVCYRDSGNSNYGTVCPLIISGSSITAGTEYVFCSEAASNMSVAMLKSDLALVSYTTSNGGYGYVCPLSISGTTITPGSSVRFNTDSSITTFTSMVRLSDSKALVCWCDQSESYFGMACVLSVSGTTISANSEFCFNAAETQDIAAVVMSETSVVVCYSSNTSPNHGAARVLTIGEAAEISIGAETAITTSTITNTSVAKVSDNQICMVYRDYSAASYGVVTLLTVADSTVTVQTSVVFNSGSTSYTTIAALNDTQAIVMYRDQDNSNYGTGTPLTLS